MNKESRKAVIKIVVVAALLAVSFFAAVKLQTNPDLASAIIRFGYVGVFFISVVSGFNLIVPIPAVAFLPALLGAGMDPYILVVVITLGMTVADSGAYFIGQAARTFTLSKHQSRIKDRIERIRRRYPRLPLFLLAVYASFVPLPNELFVVPLALLGYRPVPVILAVLIGNTIFNILAVLATLAIL